MIDEAAFEARVQRIATKLGPKVHDFIIREGSRHGAGERSQDPVAIAAYIAAISTVLGDELGSMATCMGPHGAEMVRRSFLALFDLSASEMQAEHNQADARLN